jgi:hypothetical protein
MCILNIMIYFLTVIFWIATLYFSLVGGYQCFARTCCHFQASTLKMETVCFSGVLVTPYQIAAPCHNTEDDS